MTHHHDQSQSLTSMVLPPPAACDQHSTDYADASSVVSSTSTLTNDASPAHNSKPVGSFGSTPIPSSKKAYNKVQQRFKNKSTSVLPVLATSNLADNPFIVPTSSSYANMSPTVATNPIATPVPSPTSNSCSPIISFKSNSAPNVPPFKQKEIRFPKHKNCLLIGALELDRLLKDTDPEHLLLLDVRPFIDFSKSKIRDSLHVRLPSTLLKRKNFTLERLLDNLPSPEKDQAYSKLLGPSTDISKVRIIIYDNSSNQTDSSISLGCYGISSKFLDYASWPETPPRVYILSCGFLQLQTILPELVDSSTCTPVDNATKTTPQLKLPSFHKTSKSLPSIYSSPLSMASSASSSPVSALFKFQLPSSNALPPPFFKISQNEEISNIESYISAVNINEQRRFSWEETTPKPTPKSDTASYLQPFDFPSQTLLPKKQQQQQWDERQVSQQHCQDIDYQHQHKNHTHNPNNNYTHKHCQQQPASDVINDKLNFQKKYNKLEQIHSLENINSVVPQWFQELMKASKLQFISQFQRLDLLEKKRLNQCLTNVDMVLEQPQNIPPTGNLLCNPMPSTPCAIDGTKDSRNHQHGATANHCSPHAWLDSVEDDYDEEDHKIKISSGLELGAKNRYKDIFPYEHTRVVLRKSHTPPQYSRGDEQTDSSSNDIWDTYINANYLVDPVLSLSFSSNSPPPPRPEPLREESNRCMNVRYIATQAPLAATIHDFYTCILNNNVPLILSLTDEFENGVEKCCRFWAEGNYDGIQVKLLQEYSTKTKNVPKPSNCGSASLPSSCPLFPSPRTEQGDEIIIRRIQLNYNGANHFETLQLQIKNWPDLGILMNPDEILQVIGLKNFVLDELFSKHVYRDDYVPTILVHCSAGCGRTGTLCTIDSLLSNMMRFDKLQQEWYQKRRVTGSLHPLSSSNFDGIGSVGGTSNSATGVSSRPPGKLFDPVVMTINKFRKQRISMVQNINQYLFVYDCLLQYFTLKLNKKGDNYGGTLFELTHEADKLDILEKFLENKTKEK